MGEGQQKIEEPLATLTFLQHHVYLLALVNLGRWVLGQPCFGLGSGIFTGAAGSCSYDGDDLYCGWGNTKHFKRELNILKEKLPEDRKSRYWVSIPGASAYAVVLTPSNPQSDLPVPAVYSV